ELRHDGGEIIGTGHVRRSHRPACFLFQAEDGIRDRNVTGVQTCALPISPLCSLPKSLEILRLLVTAWSLFLKTNSFIYLSSSFFHLHPNSIFNVLAISVIFIKCYCMHACRLAILNDRSWRNSRSIKYSIRV